ncbi:MAG: hypothetical protein ABS63_03575 [Microbacterium sp. SCN 70-27]|uniref:hypothetical protein n=1 Tax=unclassified Microbacterium TaxID=2609290 RepID=UPI00086F52E9|nr:MULTISPECIES: hypothetical protein [unclassified Microbacterium]MBN9224135.1 hypothetical protein [Microbacterium sp.]ODT28527.1 MAG: hypothetical protein ABS63_03575 [Microbacterium sp. SCN 70-27]
MEPTTPATLALEYGVPQKRVRDILRSLYGTLPDDRTRWALDDFQTEEVRSRLESHEGPPEWALEIGDKARRRAIHRQYGGGQQGGISTSRKTSDIFIFTNPARGSRYGYDLHEGLQADGSFAYTGEGQSGDQEFTHGNRALLNAADEGRIVRVFSAKSPYATYVGAFTTGDPVCTFQEIPGEDGILRRAIVFNLVPLDASTSLLSPNPGKLRLLKPQVVRWDPPDASDVSVPADGTQLPPGDRVVSRVEFQLQADFGRWLEERGTPPSRLRLPVAGTIIEPDMYVESEGWLAEAKKSTGREYVRMAIGQVLDYAHNARALDTVTTPMILLPGRAEADLMGLSADLGITLAARDGDSFELVRP